VLEIARRTLPWLEYYGIMRMWGKPPGEVVDFCDQTPEQAAAQFEVVAGVAGALYEQAGAQRAIPLAIQTAVLSAIPVVGAVLGRAHGMLMGFVQFMQDSMGEACQDDCRWDRPKKYESRNIIGISPPPWPYTGPSGTFIWALHDGLVVDGPASGRNDPDRFGRWVGVVTRISEDSRIGPKDKGGLLGHSGSPDIYSLVYPGSDPRRVHDPGPGGLYNWPPALPYGSYSNPSADRGDNFWYRAWRVQSILYWMSTAFACRDLRCMSAQLRLTRRGIQESLKDRMYEAERKLVAGKEGRRKGSRWYASIYQMHKDTWDLANSIDIPTLRQMAAEVDSETETDTARKFVAELEAAKGGKTYKQKDLPWPWWPVTKKLDWYDMRKLLARMAAHRGASVATISPVGQLARKLQRVVPVATISPTAQLARRLQRVTPAEQDGLGRVLLPLGAAGAAIGAVWLLTRK
jgi:hypothetical protein